MVAFGNHLKWKNGSLLLDYSISIANGIFARLISESEGFASAKEAFSSARALQVELYKILDVEEDLNADAT
jgi:hypothetical protein